MPYWKDIDSEEINHEKKNDNDIPYGRVTSILTAHPKRGCEKAAYYGKNDKKIQYHVLTLAGSLVHWKIEKYLAEKYSSLGFTLPPPFEDTLDSAQLKLYQEEIRKEDIIIKGRTVKRQRFLPKVAHAYGKFLDLMDDPNSFWNKYKVEPLYLEKIIWSDEHEYAGTIDFIGLATIKDKKYILIADWKSGKTEVPDHEIQLTAYYLALQEMIERGKIILPDYPLYSKAICIRLGGYNYEESEYLVTRKGNKNEFFRSKEIYDTVTDNARGWHIRCMFCGYGYDCNR